MSLNLQTVGVVAIRAASLGLSLAGQAKLSTLFDTLADAAEAGVNIDAHMAEVAAKLKAGPISDADVDDAMARVRLASDQLQAVKPS